MSRLAYWFLTLVFLCLSCVALDQEGPVLLDKRDDNLPARVPYIFPPPGTDPVSDTSLTVVVVLTAQIADAIRARKNGTLLDLDGVLLNDPLLAQAGSNLFEVIRSNSSLPADMRELIISRVVVLTNATYAWLQHEPVARMAGLTTEQLLVVCLAPPFFPEQGFNFSSILGSDLVAAMIFTDWITKNVYVPDNVFDGYCGSRLNCCII
ncbi:4-carboxymuconolactone decarboxylase [Mycena sanguinolenta]|uniref:4-carboxymuconolactone decarboxylase n=1 Tax=Mycena sanguinolenta TaxID=230812 RepID=A0A8H6WY87_9AGAR|nr:4-carboxymuconolactone decarboxylase [Mycena sanguinolenta]